MTDNQRNIIQQVHSITSGSAVVVGSCASELRGYVTSSKDVDFVVPTKYKQDLVDNFTVRSGSNTHPWVPELFDDFCWINVARGESHDVFFTNNLPSSSIISGANVQTHEYQLEVYRHLSSSYGHISSKVVDTYNKLKSF